MAPTQARAHATRTAILEAAASAFATGGLAGTTLNDLVRSSGVTKGAFYFHFASKEELALAAFRLKQEQLLEGMAAAVRPDQPALDRLVAMLDARVELLRQDPSLKCVLRLGQELRIGADADSEYAGFQETAITVLTDLLAEGRRDGSVRRDVEPRDDAETVFAAILGIDALSELLSGGDDLTSRNQHLMSWLRRALAPATGSRTGARQRRGPRSPR
jgi:AcrR family transcriptional regulator